MNPRVTSKIQEVNREGEGAFIPYLMAGDPSPEMSMEYIKALAEGGADIIELGVPFSDPIADGPTIQSAAVRALRSTYRFDDVLNLVRKTCRKIEIPIILMSYYNPVLQFGEEKLLEAVIEAGASGLILPDLSIGDGDNLLEIARKYNEDEVIVNAIESHHEEVEMFSPISALVQAADTISGSRRGARGDTLESYIKRLEKLEDIAENFSGVSNSYAIQAGREVRVMVEPESIDDGAADVLAKDIAAKIQDEMNYPGQVKVLIIREYRAVSYAR